MNIYKGKRIDTWGTNASLFEKLNKRYKFKVDLAANKKNAKCDKYLSDSLTINWNFGGACWLNPPFSKANVFFQKAAFSKAKIVCIYKSSNIETDLWQNIILQNANWVCFLKGRTEYERSKSESKNGVPFPSALIGFRVDCKVEDLGRVWLIQ